MIWPKDVIRELLAQASLTGEARAELASPTEAERFRFAIYSFRRTEGIGYDLSITLDTNTVVVRKKHLPSVRIVENLAHAG
jgi:hypothetical protein